MAAVNLLLTDTDGYRLTDTDGYFLTDTDQQEAEPPPPVTGLKHVRGVGLSWDAHPDCDDYTVMVGAGLHGLRSSVASGIAVTEYALADPAASEYKTAAVRGRDDYTGLLSPACRPVTVAGSNRKGWE